MARPGRGPSLFARSRVARPAPGIFRARSPARGAGASARSPLINPRARKEMGKIYKSALKARDARKAAREAQLRERYEAQIGEIELSDIQGRRGMAGEAAGEMRKLAKLEAEIRKRLMERGKMNAAVAGRAGRTIALTLREILEERKISGSQLDAVLRSPHISFVMERGSSVPESSVKVATAQALLENRLIDRQQFEEYVEALRASM